MFLYQNIGPLYFWFPRHFFFLPCQQDNEASRSEGLNMTSFLFMLSIASVCTNVSHCFALLMLFAFLCWAGMRSCVTLSLSLGSLKSVIRIFVQFLSLIYDDSFILFKFFCCFFDVIFVRFDGEVYQKENDDSFLHAELFFDSHAHLWCDYKMSPERGPLATWKSLSPFFFSFGLFVGNKYRNKCIV